MAFVRGIYRRPVNTPHKWPVTRKMFPFDDVIMMYFYMSLVDYDSEMIQNARKYFQELIYSSISRVIM